MPKATFEGLAASEPEVTAVPEREAPTEEFEAFETTVSEPLDDPGVVGLYVAENETVWLGERVNGSFSPLMEKPAPLAVACETVTAAAEGFDKVSCIVLLLPTMTEPKFKLLVERAMVLPVVLAGARPWQPVSARRHPMIRRTANEIGGSRKLSTIASLNHDRSSQSLK